MLIEVHREKLKELSVRIIKEKEDGKYELQGSGLLYIDDKDDAYILTAAHVLDKFPQNDNLVVVECFSQSELPKDVFVAEDYLFRVKRADVWSDYKGVVPDDGRFKADDVAVIPLIKAENPKRSWLDNRARASFFDKEEFLEKRGVMGFGYPKYTEERRIESACDPIGTNVVYDVHNKHEHSVEWKLDSKLSVNARHGLSGSAIALSDAQNVVLAAIVQDTYPKNDGNRIVGTDLDRIREILNDHNVFVRPAYHDQEEQTSKQLRKINDKLKLLEKNYTERGTLGKELDPDVKNLMKNVLNEVLDLNLEEKKEKKGVDCADENKKCAFRIVASVSEKNNLGIGSIRNTFVQERLHERYSRLRVLTLQSKASVSQISQKSGFTIQKDDIWDATRLFREIWNLEREKIAKISRNLDSNPPSSSQVESIRDHRLPVVPDNSSYFNSESREKELKELKELVDDAQKLKEIFVSGIGGIGKTELAIQAVLSSKSKQVNNKPVYFLRYEVPTNEEKESGIQGLKKTILNATFTNHTKGNLSPNEEYKERLGYLQTEYGNAILIVDDFNCPGMSLDDLCKEQAYIDLEKIGIQIIFTTRCALNGQRGITVGSILEEELIKIMRRHCPSKSISNDDFKMLIKLVEGHTLAVELIAKTLTKSMGRVKVDDVRKLLTDGSASVLRFPDVSCKRNGETENKKLHHHLRDLFPLDALIPEEKMLLSCAMLVPRGGMDSVKFIDILINNDPGMMKYDNEDERIYHMTERMNRLFELGWIIRDDEKWKVRMEPLIAIVCRRVIPFDPVLCEKFLEEILRYQKKLTDSMDQREFAECFDQAAAWGRESSKAVQWKSQAEQIRSEYKSQKQEVGL